MKVIGIALILLGLILLKNGGVIFIVLGVVILIGSAWSSRAQPNAEVPVKREPERATPVQPNSSALPPDGPPQPSPTHSLVQAITPENLRTTQVTSEARTGPVLFFDTETTGLPTRRNAHFSEVEVWPRLVSFAWVIADSVSGVRAHGYSIIKPSGFTIPKEAIRIHNISNEMAHLNGRTLHEVMSEFLGHVTSHSPVQIVAHNVDFDLPIVLAELVRLGLPSTVAGIPRYCTMKTTTGLLQLKRHNGSNKWPKLKELYLFLFGLSHISAHNSLSDVAATLECYCELCRRRFVHGGVLLERPKNFHVLGLPSTNIAPKLTCSVRITEAQKTANAPSRLTPAEIVSPARRMSPSAPVRRSIRCFGCARQIEYEILSVEQRISCPSCGRGMLLAPK